MQLAGDAGNREARVTGVTAVQTANTRLLRVWRDFHSGEIRKAEEGALCWRLGDRAGRFDKFGPFARLSSREERISAPRDEPHPVIGGGRLWEPHGYLKPKIRDRQDERPTWTENCSAAY